MPELNTQQIGNYGEYHAKMELTKMGHDVYTSEVDDKGIDFIVRVGRDDKDEKPPRYIDIQVKTVTNLNYVYMKKSKFRRRKNNSLMLILLDEELNPDIFYIPSVVWKKPNELFVDRKYTGKKTPPEWGVLLAQKRLSMLEKYRLRPETKL
jgi:hypothetical protein